jgi:PAS domain S-box-containing protein
MNLPEVAKTKKSPPVSQSTSEEGEATMKMPTEIFADLEATLDEVARVNPRLVRDTDSHGTRDADLRALLEVSLAVNSSLVLDDVLQLVMRKAIELMQAERGLVMLLDQHDELQLKAAYNLCEEEMAPDDFRISNSISREVADTGKSVYTSDAQSDDRFAQQQSVIELHLRSIMCVPLKAKHNVIGVIYLDNSSQTRMFLKSDLYLFELYAQMVSNALHNAHIHDTLMRMEEYNDSVVINSPVGIVVLDALGQILTFNPKGLEIFDLDREKVNTLQDDRSPTRFLDTLPEDQQARWRAMINLVLTTKHDVSEPRLFHNTGYMEKVLSLRLSPLANLPNDGDGLIMAIEDITDKVTMEQYVILSEKLVARGEMAASVAHELNNYLSIICNNAELLSINIAREKYEKVNHNAKSITENVLKTKRFVENLMDFAKPNPEYISYDLRRLVDDLLFSLRIQPRFKLMHFTIDLPENIPNIEIDVGQIQQVLHNLLNNAADAIDEKASSRSEHDGEFRREIGLKATYNQAQEQFTIQVSDNGIGMSPDTLNKIFTLHFTTKKGGHGIGLYNCKIIAEEHGGHLAVTSAIDEGTTFTLTLPRFQQDTPGKQE